MPSKSRRVSDFPPQYADLVDMFAASGGTPVIVGPMSNKAALTLRADLYRYRNAISEDMAAAKANGTVSDWKDKSDAWTNLFLRIVGETAADPTAPEYIKNSSSAVRYKMPTGRSFLHLMEHPVESYQVRVGDTIVRSGTLKLDDPDAAAPNVETAT